MDDLDLGDFPVPWCQPRDLPFPRPWCLDANTMELSTSDCFKSEKLSSTTPMTSDQLFSCARNLGSIETSCRFYNIHLPVVNIDAIQKRISVSFMTNFSRETKILVPHNWIMPAASGKLGESITIRLILFTLLLPWFITIMMMYVDGMPGHHFLAGLAGGKTRNKVAVILLSPLIFYTGLFCTLFTLVGVISVICVLIGYPIFAMHGCLGMSLYYSSDIFGAHSTTF